MMISKLFEELNQHHETCHECQGGRWCAKAQGLAELMGEEIDNEVRRGLRTIEATFESEISDDQAEALGNLFGLPVRIKRIEHISLNRIYYGFCDNHQGFGMCQGHFSALALDARPELMGYMLAVCEDNNQPQRVLISDLGEAKRGFRKIGDHAAKHLGRTLIYEGPALRDWTL